MFIFIGITNSVSDGRSGIVWTWIAKLHSQIYNSGYFHYKIRIFFKPKNNYSVNMLLRCMFTELY